MDYISIDDVVPAPLNPKNHDVEELARGFKRFAYTNPLLICERKGQLVAGHGRLAALKLLRELGESEPDGIKPGWFVPVIRGWSSVNDSEYDLYLAADNQHTIKPGWHEDILLGLLTSPQVDDLDGTGFTLEDLDALNKSALDDLTDKDSQSASGSKFQVIVKCRDLEHQQEVVEMLRAEGLDADAK